MELCLLLRVKEFELLCISLWNGGLEVMKILSPILQVGEEILSINTGFCCCWSVSKSCLTLCNPMDCSMPGLPVTHHLLEFAQVHVHWISDAIQPSHPLLSPSPAVNLSQHQGLFRWPKYWKFSVSTSSSNEYSGLIFFRIDWLISLLCKGYSRVLSSTTGQNHKFFGTLLLYGPALISTHDYYYYYHSLDYMNLCRKVMSSLINILLGLS